MSFRSGAGVLLVLLLAGCSGGPADPFERSHAQGTVAIEGKPVEFGTITFTGEKSEKTQETAIALAQIRNGKFSTEEAGRAPSVGENRVNVTVYDRDPDGGEGEPQIVGTWEGVQPLPSEGPISIDIKQDDLLQ